MIQVELPKVLKQMVEIKPGQLEYIGNKNLLQFEVRDFSMKSFSNNSIVEVEFTLQRMFKYHLVSTYMPTVCLLIIVEITLFIDESHFESNIMVALTGMLVMYTLYQSISLTLPSTAYLKLLDIWLIFSLIMPFVIFMIEVFWQLQVAREETDNKTRTANRTKRSSSRRPPNRKYYQAAILSSSVLFATAYFAYAIRIYMK